MRKAPASIRFAVAIVLALLLGARLLSPAGFMPSFEHGSVTIVACPDYDPPSSMAHHRPAPMKSQHHCPYATGSAAAVPIAVAILAALLIAGTAVLLGRTYRFVERHRLFERPPLRGPPIPV